MRRMGAVVVLGLTLSLTAAGGVSAEAGPEGAEATASSSPVTTPAQADPTTAAPQAGASFLDDQALSLTSDQLATAEGLTESIRNDAAQAQTISMRVVGLARAKDPDVAQLLAATPTSPEPVEPGQVEDLTIPLGEADVEPGEYKGTLVAYGQYGPIARRSLTLTITAPKPSAGEQPQPPDESVSGISADTASALTVAATNYLPSVLAPFAAFFLTVGLVGLVVVWWAIRSLLASRPSDKQFAAGICVVLAILGGFLLFRRDLSELESVHAISVRPVPVSGVASGTNIGTAQDKSGQLASLQVRDDRIWPNGLDRAGEYTGSYDLTPGEDGGGSTATINVRDWWVWAAGALALGLWLGYLLRSWFLTGRARRQVEIKLATTNQLLGHNDVEFDRATRGTVGFTMHERATKRRQDIDTQLDAGDVTEAKAAADSLATYVLGLIEARELVADYLEDAAKIRLGLAKHDFGVAETTVAVLDRLPALHLERFDSSDPDTDEERLKAVKDELTTLHADAAAVMQMQKDILTMLGTAKAHMDVAKEFVETTLTQHARDVLQEADSEKLKELRTRTNELETELRELVKPKDRKAAEEMIMVPVAIDMMGLVRNIQAIEEGSAPTLVLSEARPEPKIELHYEVARPDGIEVDATVRVEDWVQLAITFPDRPGFDFVVVDVGDGSPSAERAVPLEFPATVRVPVSYGQAGKYEVSITPRGEATPIVTKEVEVAPLSQRAALQASYAAHDEAMRGIAFVVAVGSGLVALYVVSAGWGKPGDYLEAVLWGGAVGEGTTFVAAIVQRTLGDSK